MCFMEGVRIAENRKRRGAVRTMWAKVMRMNQNL